MAGYYSTYKVFTPGEILTASDLNASEQQHVTFQQATVTEGYSRTLGESRIQASSATLATTVADEISRIREKIRLLGNVQYWDQVLGPAANPAMPKAQILLPLEGATPADGTNVPAGVLGNNAPGLFIRKSVATPPQVAPAIIETVYEFAPQGGQSLMWKITTPLGYVPGGLAEVVLKFSIKENKGGNVRWLATLAAIVDEASNVGFAVAPASMWGPDNIPVPIWGAQKEVRIQVPATIGENSKCFVIITGWPAAVSNCESPRFLESATIEFTRGAFVVQNPGMPNPMIEQGDIIIGWTSGSPIRLDGGLNSQVLTMVGGMPSWQNPPAGMQNPMVAAGDLIVGQSTGTPARFPIGANGQLLAVAGGGLIWQNPTTTTRPNVDYIDFTGGTLIPLPPANHAYMGVENISGVPNLTLAGPLGGKMRIGGLGGPWVGVQFHNDAGQSLMEFVTDNGETWVGSDQVHKTHLYTGSALPPYFMTNVSLRPDGHVEFGAGGIYLRQLPTALTGEATFTAIYARNDKRLYYKDDGDIERPVDPIQARGDIIVGNNDGAQARLSKGLPGQVLTTTGLDIEWAEPIAGGNPLTASGDMIYALAGGIQTRLPIGAAGRVLTVVAGVPDWQIPSGLANPMTQVGDLVVGGATGTPVRLGIGVEGRFLAVSGGTPVWAIPPGFANPMTAVGDLIRGGTSGDPTRLAPGANGFVLTMVGGIPTWAVASGGMANPMTTAGDIIIGAASGTPARVGIGTAGHVLTVIGTTPTWAAPSGGMNNPMTSPADLIIGGASGTPTRLGVGSNTQVLTIVGGNLEWATPTSGGMSNPMTTLGDIIVGGAAGAQQRLGVGAETQMLAIVGGVPAWKAPTSGGMTNPMTTVGDLILGGTSGAANRLARGSNNQYLGVASNTVQWITPTFMTNPLTTTGDIIRSASGSTPSRLGIGTTGQVLTVVAGLPAWATPSALTNPMTTLGDIITGAASGVPGRLAIGTTGQVLTVVGGVPAWAAAAMTNPMTAPGDIIRGGTAGAPTRLAKGTDGQFLTLVSGLPSWQDGFTNPMTTGGDIIVGGPSGTPARLGVGSEGFVLTIAAGTPSWAAQTALVNPMTNPGDLIVGGTGGSPSRLAAVATGRIFASAGVNATPVWSQDVKLGLGTIGVSGSRVIAIGGSSAPTSSPVDTVQLYAEDLDATDGKHGLIIRDEIGSIFKIGSPLTDYPTFRMKPVGASVDVIEISCGSDWGGIGTTPAGIDLSLWSAGATKWTIAAAGNFFPAVDTAYDIGTNAKKIRDIHIGGNIGIATGTIYGGHFTGSSVTANTYAHSGTTNGWMIFNSGGYLSGNANLTTNGANLTVASSVDAQGGLISRTDLYVQNLASTGRLIFGSASGWLTHNGNLHYNGWTLHSAGDITVGTNFAVTGSSYLGPITCTTIGASGAITANDLNFSSGGFAGALFPASGNSYLRLFPAGGIYSDILAAGTGSGYPVGTLVFSRSSGGVLMQFNIDGNTYLACGGLGAKLLSPGPANSAGAGWRTLSIQN